MKMAGIKPGRALVLLLLEAVPVVLRSRIKPGRAQTLSFCFMEHPAAVVYPASPCANVIPSASWRVNKVAGIKRFVFAGPYIEGR